MAGWEEEEGGDGIVVLYEAAAIYGMLVVRMVGPYLSSSS